MKKYSKVGIIGIALVIVAVALIAVFSLGKSISGNENVSGDSVISVGYEYVYYNDANGDIIRKDITTEETEVFAESLTLMAATETNVLACDTTSFFIMDYTGAVVDEVHHIAVAAAQLTDDYIYYKHIDSGFIVAMNRETKDENDLLKIEVDKFKVVGNKIVFTTKDKNMVYIYDTETGIPMGYFGDKQISHFDFSETKIIYSDMSNDGMVAVMDILSGEESVFEGVRSENFVYDNGVLYYIENVEKNSEKYELKVAYSS